MRSFIVKMRVTELREYVVEARSADEAAERADRGEVKDYAHCHTMDWEVCDVAPGDKADTL